jgi:hypothetical protein
MNHCYQLICISQEKDLLELDDAAHLSGMHREMIEVFLRAGIVKSKPDLNGLRRTSAPDTAHETKKPSDSEKYPLGLLTHRSVGKSRARTP